MWALIGYASGWLIRLYGAALVIVTFTAALPFGFVVLGGLIGAGGWLLCWFFWAEYRRYRAAY